MQIMRRQLGVLDFAPLKPLFLSLAASAHAVAPGLPSAPPLLAPLGRPGGMPRLCITLAGLIERLKAAHGLVTGGKFPEALEAFAAIVAATTLTVVESRQQVGGHSTPATPLHFIMAERGSLCDSSRLAS